jgi:hypothetical protein
LEARVALTEAEIQIARLVASTLFPEEGAIAVGAEQAHVLPYWMDYFERLPNLEQVQVRALLQATELGFAAWSRSPRARFSTASPEDRWAYLESWAHSTNHVQQMVFEGLRTMFLLGYVDSPEVRRAIGNFGDGGLPGATPTAEA